MLCHSGCVLFPSVCCWATKIGSKARGRRICTRPRAAPTLAVSVGLRRSMAHSIRRNPSESAQAATRRGGAADSGRAGSGNDGRRRRLRESGRNFRPYCVKVQAVRLAGMVQANTSTASGMPPEVRRAPARVKARAMRKIRNVFIVSPWSKT